MGLNKMGILDNYDFGSRKLTLGEARAVSRQVHMIENRFLIKQFTPALLRVKLAEYVDASDDTDVSADTGLTRLYREGRLMVERGDRIGPFDPFKLNELNKKKIHRSKEEPRPYYLLNPEIEKPQFVDKRKM